MKTVFYLLEQIRHRPSMYTGGQTRRVQLQNIEQLLHGYAIALLNHDIDEPAKNFNREFGYYLERTRDWSTSCGPVAAVFDAIADDEAAWSKYWELVEEFRQSLGAEATAGDRFIKLKALIQSSDSDDVCLRELRAALSAPDLQEHGPGVEPAGSVLAAFQIRKRTAEAGGVETCGVDTTLEALAKLPAMDLVNAFHFGFPDRHFTVFVTVADEEIVGCLRVTRRSRPAG
jgi:hypothetical protein